VAVAARAMGQTKRRRKQKVVYTGLASAFRKAGFEEVLRRSPTRPIVRRIIKRGS
jgi:hypothetical protein